MRRIREMSEENQTIEKEEQRETPSRSVAEYIKRYIFLVVGLAIMSFGVAFSINAELGTSPVSSIPYVTSEISGLSVGTTTIIVNTIIVLLQIVVLRRRFKLIRLLQIPVCVVFGLLIDVAGLCIEAVVPDNYFMQWLLCVCGIVLVAVGVAFEMSAGVLTLAGEGLVQALCTVLPKVKFGYMKVMVDVSFVVIAVVLSFIFLHELQGVREGTVAAAIFVGLIAKFLNRFISPVANKLFADGKRLKVSHGNT